MTTRLGVDPANALLRGLDLEFKRHGGLVILAAHTQRGFDWIADNVDADEWQVIDEHGIAVEPRYVAGIVRGALAADMVVEWEGVNIDQDLVAASSRAEQFAVDMAGAVCVIVRERYGASPTEPQLENAVAVIAGYVNFSQYDRKMIMNEVRRLYGYAPKAL